MKTLLICGSNSLTSINGRIMDVILGKETADSLYLSKYTDIPILNRDFYAKEGVPEEVKEIYSILRSYGKLVFFVPENNGYLSSFFKNIIDWLSLVEQEFLKGKRVFLVSVSTTQRESRIMEDSVIKTFGMFYPSTLRFVNFKGFGTEKDKENIYNLISIIFG